MITYGYIMYIRTARELGGAIRIRRRQLGWSQDALADKVGVSRRWIVTIEQGKPGAEVSLVLRSMNVLGLVADVIQAPVASGPVDLDRLLNDHDSA